MKQIIIILIALMILPTIALATCTETSGVSATISSSVTRATAGSNILISTSMSATTSCSADSVQMVSNPTGMSTTDPASGSYSGVSLSTTPTTGYPFTITSSTTGTFSIWASVDGITSSTTEITFVNPALVSVSGSPASATKSRSDSFSLTLNIQNGDTTNTTSASYALSQPADISCSGDQTSGTLTISAGSTTQLQYTCTVSASASAGAKNINLQLGSNTAAFTSTITVNAVATTASTTSGGGGSAGGAGVTGAKISVDENKATVTASYIAAYGSLDITLNRTVLDVGIEKLKVGINDKPLESIKLIIEKAACPSTPPETQYKCLSITMENMTNEKLNNITFQIAVDKSWVTSNNIDSTTVALYRYTTDWDKLTTTRLYELTDSISYEATSPGLSYFAITGKTMTAPVSETTEDILGGEIAPGTGITTGLVLVIGVIIVIAVYLYLRKKK